MKNVKSFSKAEPVFVASNWDDL